MQPGLCSANQREAKRHHSKGKGEGSIEAGTFIRFRTAGALAAPHANIFHPAESEFAKRKSSASRFRVSLHPRCKMKDWAGNIIWKSHQWETKINRLFSFWCETTAKLAGGEPGQTAPPRILLRLILLEYSHEYPTPSGLLWHHRQKARRAVRALMLQLSEPMQRRFFSQAKVKNSNKTNSSSSVQKFKTIQN